MGKKREERKGKNKKGKRRERKLTKEDEKLNTRRLFAGIVQLLSVLLFRQTAGRK